MDYKLELNRKLGKIAPTVTTRNFRSAQSLARGRVYGHKTEKKGFDRGFLIVDNDLDPDRWAAEGQDFLSAINAGQYTKATKFKNLLWKAEGYEEVSDVKQLKTEGADGIDWEKFPGLFGQVRKYANDIIIVICSHEKKMAFETSKIRPLNHVKYIICYIGDEKTGIYP